MFDRTIRIAAALGLTLAMAAPAARATTLTTSLMAFQTGVGAATVTTTGTSGAFDTSGFILPTTNVIDLNDGTTLGLVNFDQVQQPPSGFSGYPFYVSTGYAGDLFSPEDANGNPLKSETITVSNGQSALGFYILPNSDAFALASSTITATLSNGLSTSFALASAPTSGPNAGIATPAFIGFFGGGVSSITITTSDANGFAFGNFQDVPEPASAALLLAGVVFTRLRARGRRIVA